MFCSRMSFPHLVHFLASSVLKDNLNSSNSSWSSIGSLAFIFSQLRPFSIFCFTRNFQLLKAVLIFVMAKRSTFLLNGSGNVYRW